MIIYVPAIASHYQMPIFIASQKFYTKFVLGTLSNLVYPIDLWEGNLFLATNLASTGSGLL
jgi:hypothetical protein